MRIAHLALVSAIGFAISPFAAQAYVPAPAANGETSPNIVAVAVNCGPHAHYVRGHRDAHGHYIKGVCVRDRPPPRPPAPDQH